MWKEIFDVDLVSDANDNAKSITQNQKEPHFSNASLMRYQ